MNIKAEQLFTLLQKMITTLEETREVTKRNTNEICGIYEPKGVWKSISL